MPYIWGIIKNINKMTLQQVYTILNETIGDINPDTYIKLSNAISKHSTASFQEGADMVKRVYNIK